MPPHTHTNNNNTQNDDIIALVCAELDIPMRDTILPAAIKGEGAALAQIIRYFFLKRWRAVASFYMQRKNYVFFAASDRKIVQAAFRLLRSEFGYETSLTPQQFWADSGKVYLKFSFLHELTKTCRRENERILRDASSGNSKKSDTGNMPTTTFTPVLTTTTTTPVVATSSSPPPPRHGNLASRQRFLEKWVSSQLPLNSTTSTRHEWLPRAASSSPFRPNKSRSESDDFYSEASSTISSLHGHVGETKPQLFFSPQSITTTNEEKDDINISPIKMKGKKPVTSSSKEIDVLARLENLETTFFSRMTRLEHELARVMHELDKVLSTSTSPSSSLVSSPVLPPGLYRKSS